MFKLTAKGSGVKNMGINDFHEDMNKKTSM